LTALVGGHLLPLSVESGLVYPFGLARFSFALKLVSSIRVKLNNTILIYEKVSHLNRFNLLDESLG
jgi:hypothetical protein